jgi:hypothetical protein
MAEPRERTPITDLPIKLFKPMAEGGEYLALLSIAGKWQCVFLAPTAMDAKRKAKAWAEAQEHQIKNGNKVKRTARAVEE